MKKAYLNTNTKLISGGIDCYFSGTTVVGVLKLGSKLYSANVGDSRAVICSQKHSRWSVKELTHDQKPDNPSELQRIRASGGRVAPYYGII